MSKVISITLSSVLLVIILYLILNIKKIEKSVSINALEDKKVIAFTFDDGPSEYSIEIARVLKSYGFKGTFFEIGSKMKDNQEIVKKLLDLGMEIGSHSYTHKLLTSLEKEEVLRELNSTKILFNEITGENITLTRFPYGMVNNSISKYALTPIIGWSIDTKDWYYKNSECIINEIIKAKDGDIIIMHDTYKETLDAIKEVLPILNEKGFIITSVSELALLKNKVLKNNEIYNNIYN